MSGEFSEQTSLRLTPELRRRIERLRLPNHVTGRQLERSDLIRHLLEVGLKTVEKRLGRKSKGGSK